MKIGILLGSVRKGRLGERVGKWVVEGCKQAGASYELLDLEEYQLPPLDSAVEPHAANKEYPHVEVVRWSKQVEECSAFIIVSAEYNHGYTAALKNSIDWLYPEWAGKRVGVVSYSTGPVGGARMIEHLLPVLNHVGMSPLQTAISLGKANELISEAGTCEVAPLNELLQKMIASLVS